MKTWRGTIVVAYKTKPTRILLIENKGSGKITSPGGAIEDREDELIAAAREIKEEVGWDIQPSMLVKTGIKHEFTYGPNKPERAGDSASNQIFLLNADSLTEPKETNDAKNPKWFEANEGIERMSFKDVSLLIKKALEANRLLRI